MKHTLSFSKSELPPKLLAELERACELEFGKAFAEKMKTHQHPLVRTVTAAETDSKSVRELYLRKLFEDYK